ncbi:MAG: NAD-dependent deacetylase [Actinomycetota bacterium]|nr:NAD-dependent deacetylase [Actinomycetota bacterium]
MEERADPTIPEVRGWIERAQRVLVLTGAGISTDSGIPDFRGPNGVWTKDPEAEKTATLQHYLADPDIRKRSWQNRLTSPIWDAQPNAAHLAIAELERRGQLHMLVTQNIDGLHALAGISPSRIVEIHGNARTVMCWECGDRAPMERALARVRAGEDDPPCRSCGGILKSDTISFGQNLRPDDIVRAEAAAQSCDLLLAIGSTLTVYPAAGIVPVARNHGATLVIVNGEETAFDDWADAVLRGPIGEIVPSLLRPPTS